MGAITLKDYLLAAFLVVSMNLMLTNTHAQESIPECEAKIVANKDFVVLKGKLDLLNAADQPTEILGNGNTPSKAEKVAIAKWVEEYKKCSKAGIEYHKSRSLEVGTMFENAYSELYFSAADLYQGKITYGDFARGTIKRHREVRERIAVIVARFQEQQQRIAAEKNQAEANERQREEYRQQAEVMQRQEQQRQAQMRQAQQQQLQQQREYEMRQYCQQKYQQCLYRKGDNATGRGACGMENAGCSIGTMLSQ